MSKKKKPAVLTLADFIRLAADRGCELWTLDEREMTWFTDGSRRYALPKMRSGYLPANYVESLCEYFSLPYLDFALDPKGED